MNYSPLAVEIFNEYAREFQGRWGIDLEVAAVIGARGKTLWQAEFTENGYEAYRTSVVLPIRNAFYAASVMDKRWAALSQLGLTEPILDYGCGVGFQLLWLRRMGFKQLYGYEIPGVQRAIMSDMLGKNGVGLWRPGQPMETVLCINVLEHVNDPVGLLEKLLTIGKRVVANICIAHDSSHIASHEELEKCRAILTEKGTLYSEAA